MKKLAIILLFLQLSANADEITWYTLLGPSFFDENIETNVGSGAGGRGGLGLEITDRLAVEVVIDRANPTPPDDLAASINASSYEITTVSNRYISGFVVLRTPLSERISLICKTGLSRYSNEIEINVLDQNNASRSREENSGVSPSISGGLLFSIDRYDKHQVEFAITRFTESVVRATTLSVAWRVNFRS